MKKLKIKVKITINWVTQCFLKSKKGFSLYFFKDFIYLFLEKGRNGEREGEKHPCVVASHTSPAGYLARTPGMCPDWESNR